MSNHTTARGMVLRLLANSEMIVDQLAKYMDNRIYIAKMEGL